MQKPNNRSSFLLIFFLILLSGTLVFAQNSGAIWTTESACGDETQDQNHYAIGEIVYVNGSNFDPNTEYDWKIEGQPGGASCDPGIVVASGTILTDENGDFCFDAYTVQNDDCGEYKVNVGNKGDNYRVDGNPSIDVEKSTNGVDADTPTGPQLMEGDAVVWEYVVTNTGNVVLKNITVTDDKIGEIGTIDELAPGESQTLQYEGTAQAGQYANLATVEGKYGKDTVSDEDPSHYFGVAKEPSLDIEKATNGVDADDPTGPELYAGDAVTWAYVVTNTGNVTLTNIVVTDDILGTIGTIPSLAPGASETLTANGTASVGQYKNVGTASTTYEQTRVEDSDPSHYLGVERPAPSLDIEKATNGVDADDPTGPSITVGDQVTWTYVVTNTGNVTLENIKVTDDQIGDIGTISSLKPGESKELTKTGTAALGQYANVGMASTTYDDEPVEDTDPSHYIGVEAPTPSLDIEKATNGQDADDPTGPQIIEGEQVTWTYVVTNTGNVTLENIKVTDDKLGDIDTIPSLAPGESKELTKTGTAALGQYRNVGKAYTMYDDEKVEDSDPSHYLGVEQAAPSLKIEKSTNGVDADDPKGPEIMVGEKVTWTYVVTNTGNVTLEDIKVTDDVLGDVGTIPSLAPGKSAELTMKGTAVAGQYGNIGTACTTFEQTRVCDEDPSHYFGIRPDIKIEKATNGVDADDAPGVYLFIGDEVVWTYVVTNTGNVPLTNVVVKDDQLGTICTIEYLGVGQQSTCEVKGLATEGQYKNVGEACGMYEKTKVCDDDPSHYFGSEKPMPSIDIEKATNGEDADAAPGPLVLEGSTVTWTYVVTNTGNVPLYNVVVTDDKEGEICTFEMLAVGESQECQATGEAIVGQYENMATAIGWYQEEKVWDRDLSHYVGEKFTETDPDDFAVCISFKDKDGNYVGDVMSTLSIPGEKDWKVLSSWDEILAGGMWPCNAHFRRLAYNVGGTYKFTFKAPDGWKFISPDHWEIQVPEGEHYYNVSGNIFYLERTTTTSSTITLPDNPVIPPDAEANSLIYIKGSPTARGEGWDNLVDGDTEGWDGTTTAQMQDTSPAYAIFRFADGNAYQFTHVKLQTDNGDEDDRWSNRQVSKIDIQVSNSGLQESDFVSVGVLKVNSGEMKTYKLSQMVKAKYVKLVLLQPNWTPGGWAQLVEFALDSPSKRGAQLASDDFEFSAVPEVFSLKQNYPNPFNPVTTIQYDLPSDSHVTLMIFDINGRLVDTLVDESQSAGSYSIQWDGSTRASGLYFYSIQAGKFKALHKMTLVK